MRLDQMTVALRVRSPWQAMDLGLRMVRANARAIWVPYLQFTLPIFILCNVLAYFTDQLWLGWFLPWWLKPLFDRIPLHVLSHVTFGNQPSRRETLRAPFKWRWGMAFSWLTYRRFSFWRSMSMPVDVLEELSTTRLSQRRSVLVSAVSAQMMGLTFICICFELVIYLSIVTLFYMFMPVEYLEKTFQAFENNFLNNTPAWADLISNFLAYIGIVVISPFYVGAGFAAYLNRRTQLEAWDIEIAFKRIATRLKPASSAMILVLGLLSGAGFSHHARAENAGTTDSATKANDSELLNAKTIPKLFGDEYQTEPKSVAQAFDKAYQDKHLSPKQKVTTWEPKKKQEIVNDEQDFSKLELLLKPVAAIIAFFAEYGLWILFAFLLAFLVWRFRDWMPWLADNMPAKRELSTLTEQEVINLETLPSDLSHAVRQLWQQQPRAALALLYRASVERLADRLGVYFPPGATESECLRRAKRLSQPESEAIFKRVVRAWQAAAYAHRLPNHEEFESLLSEWSLRWEKDA